MDIFIPIGIVLAVVIFFVWATKSGGKLIKEREEKISRAEAGKAKILGYKTVGFMGRGAQGQFHANRFDLEVSNAYKSPYKAVAMWNVYEMAIPTVQIGKEVDVKIDADDPQIIYPNLQGVEYSWSAAIIEAGHKK